jgi:hypothetical protein
MLKEPSRYLTAKSVYTPGLGTLRVSESYLVRIPNTIHESRFIFQGSSLEDELG